MNKKLIILIVALECVFSVFLISIFGPMIEALHSKIIVEDVYFVDEAGVRIEDDSSIVVDLDQTRSFHFDFEVVTLEATDRTVKILHNREDNEIQIVEDVDGFGFTVIFLKKVESVKITVRAKDTSQKETSITVIKRDSDVEIDPFG